MKRSSLPFLIFAIIATAGSALADDGKLSGYVLSDYFYVASHHDSDLEDRSGFLTRRIYFTYDKNLENGFSTRLRTEMSQPGDFSTSSKMTPAVKDAYLKYKTAGGSQLIFGIQPTPTWEVIEKQWGYRSVEKTALDLWKYGSSRDFGLSFKGKVASDKTFYHFMFANGSSNKSEDNKQKKVMAALGMHLSDRVLVQGYADFEAREGEMDRSTVQGFLAYRTDSARIGVQFSRQTRKNGPSTDDSDWTIWSAFAALEASENTTVFARVDTNSDPVPGGEGIAYIPFAETAKPLFFVGGVDFAVSKGVHIIPNIEVVSYSDVDAAKSGTPDSDIIPRLTLYYKF